MQTMRRGEEYRDSLIHRRFIRQVEVIGPKPGIEVSMMVTNKGKWNTVGRLEYTGTCPHIDPLRDTAAWHGILWLFRFAILKEPFPNVLNRNEYFDWPTYRAIHTITPMSESSYSETWHNFFSDAGACVGKLTHQPRRQGQQEMADAGWDPGDISRMVGYKGSACSHEQNKDQVRS